MSTTSVAEAKSLLMENSILLDESMTLALPTLAIRFNTNSQRLLDELKNYFSAWLTDSPETECIDVVAIQREEASLGVSWADWKREPGKRGKKDAWFDLDGGRLIRKVRTGMVFLQSTNARIAAGPCEANPNQVINFINNQYMTALQQQGWLICHAAAMTKGEQAVAFAGFSGGGKSTSMLHLLSEPSLAFLSNDRLFLKQQGHEVIARGVPKMPRINPGTIVNNPHLSSLITDEDKTRYLAMPKEALWDLEEKYDADVEACFGPGKVSNQGSLTHFYVLSWKHGDSAPTKIQPVSLREKPELLEAIMKTSGPFYQKADASFLTDDDKPEPNQYLDVLEGVTLLEVSGGVNFEVLKAHCLQLLED